MTEFKKVAKVGDLNEGDCTTVEAGGKTIAVFCTGGQYHAIEDFCPHMGASLAGGHVEGGVVTCPWHAWRFRLSDGAWVDNPRLKIGCFQVRVEGDEIQVEVPPKKGGSGS